MTDKHNREINYLRLSVTDRCNLRCNYCMPAEGIEYMDKEHLLSYEEMLRLINIFVPLGINKLRITGGEPLVRKNLVSFLSQVRELHPKLGIHLTTNGSLLHQHLEALVRIKLNGINLSLDAYDRETFFEITRRDDFPAVQKSLISLLQTPIPIKINAVVMANKNTHCLSDMVKLAKDYKVEVRFIEEMPFNGTNASDKLYWSSEDIENYVKLNFPEWESQPKELHSSARIFKSHKYPGSLGIIDAYSRSFCGTCNRIRINAQGDLINCLYGKGEASLRDLMRGGSSDEEIASAIGKIVLRKYKDGFEAEQTTRRKDTFFESMSTIGG